MFLSLASFFSTILTLVLCSCHGVFLEKLHENICSQQVTLGLWISELRQNFNQSEAQRRELWNRFQDSEAQRKSLEKELKRREDQIKDLKRKLEQEKIERASKLLT